MLDGDPAHAEIGDTPPFSAHVYRGHTAGCIRVQLGTEVDLGPDDIVLDGDPAPQKGAHPHFSTMIIVANGMDVQDAAC